MRVPSGCAIRHVLVPESLPVLQIATSLQNHHSHTLSAHIELGDCATSLRYLFARVLTRTFVRTEVWSQDAETQQHSDSLICLLKLNLPEWTHEFAFSAGDSCNVRVENGLNGLAIPKPIVVRSVPRVRIAGEPPSKQEKFATCPKCHTHELRARRRADQVDKMVGPKQLYQENPGRNTLSLLVLPNSVLRLAITLKT